ncbi:MAG: M2 family metallopeptidase [candidate division KSB1 bacterium]|nr:M2 family metallopeptidase [candidate division KSB1 bacterium]
MKKLCLLVLLLSLLSCGPNSEEKQLKTFVESYTEQVKPLHKKANLAYWRAATTGNEQAFQESGNAELEIRKTHSDSQKFALLNSLKESAQINDPLLQRQLTVLYNRFLKNQIDPDLLKSIVDKQTEIEQKFSTFRPVVNGDTLNNNRIEKVLKNEINSKVRQQIWSASKKVGAHVAPDIIELVKYRNKAAQSIGFPDYHSMSLIVSEQSPAEIDEIFRDLEERTNEPFMNIKAELDSVLADMYGVGITGLMPWHYHDPFFQETPLVYEIDLDPFYADHDVVDLAQTFYEGIGLPVDSILAHSDLYERKGKNPHAFCIDIDRQGDVRILCNVKNNERWMETMLHELGHAVYDRYMSLDTPYILREPAHAFTTEGIAMLFGRQSRDAEWMRHMLDLSQEEYNEIKTITEKYAQLKQLIFARWAMVMYQFEKALYSDPNQDLNQLWWSLVQHYQLISKPTDRDKPDWAAKIHIALYPCYYHNYLLGELFASQLHHHIIESDNNKTVFAGNRKIGSYLKKNVFIPANTMPWDEMIRQATGEPLSALYFVHQFVN